MRGIAYFFGIAAFGTLLLCAGCTKEEKTVSGVVIGAGSGALIGGLAGGGGGAAAGGVVGCVLGGVVGHEMGYDKKEHKHHRNDK